MHSALYFPRLVPPSFGEQNSSDVSVKCHSDRYQARLSSIFFMFRQRAVAACRAVPGLSPSTSPFLVRHFTSGGKGGIQVNVTGLHEDPAISRRKLNLSHLIANRKDRDFALSAFFATHRPLVNVDDLTAATRASMQKRARDVDRDVTDIGKAFHQHLPRRRGLCTSVRRSLTLSASTARYNDEYAKIFNTFTPHLPPSHHKLFSSIDPAVMPSTMSGSSSDSYLGTASNSNPKPTVADYLVYKSINKPLPSTLHPPSPPPTETEKKAAAVAILSRRPSITPDDEDVLAAFYASAETNCGMTMKQMVDNSGPAYQVGQHQPLPPQSLFHADRSEEAFERMTTMEPDDDAVMRASTVGRRQRLRRDERKTVVHAISILKRRRKKMNKHKWKKARAAVRDSTRYNKERRKKGGAQREKQE
ncbi:hypothetical protein HKX48_005676 [Thoreauomyces humboldtii]|nr:hypothetical protein HKX48_005676 [Thoreauomyces humboldtii]